MTDGRGWLQYEAGPDKADTQAMARIIFDSALLESGYIIKSPKEFNQRIYDLLARTHDIKGDLSAPTEFDDSVSPASSPAASVGNRGAGGHVGHQGRYWNKKAFLESGSFLAFP